MELVSALVEGLRPGEVFANDYRVMRPLASGGMGAVYVALQLSTARERALKIMLGELASNAELKRRFEQEAKIGAQIESEHVVEVVGAGIDGATGAPWLAMELLVGEDLAHHLMRTGPLPSAAVLDVFEQLCHAVGAAHNKQIIHRDLKPENIFLAQTRRAGGAFTLKVLDFGIAKLVGQARTSATAAVGTPLWMAPEQTQRASGIGPAADVWALGLIAFRMLAGKPYWRCADDPEATAMMVLREVVMEPLVPATQRSAEIGGARLPSGFDGWFARSVDRNPAARFPDASAMLAELRTVLGGRGESPSRLASATPEIMPHTDVPASTAAAAPIASLAALSPVVVSSSSQSGGTMLAAPIPLTPMSEDDDKAFRRGRARPAWVLPAMASGVALLGIVVVVAVVTGRNPPATQSPTTTNGGNTASSSPREHTSPAPAATPVPCAAPIAPVPASSPSASTDSETLNVAGHAWQKQPSRNTMSWLTATAYCKSLELAGGGWRLPTAEELRALWESKAVEHEPQFYWSASSPPSGFACGVRNEDPERNFVNFDTGLVASYCGSWAERVRCVR